MWLPFERRTRERLSIELAKYMATLKHAGQFRKYTGEPYVNHCIEVGNLLRSVHAPINVVLAGILHDTIEDTNTTATEIALFFNQEVANLVLEVTDVSKPSDGNRAARKELDRVHFSKASRGGQLIKLADLISNTKSIVKHDPNFAKVYLVEAKKLLDLIEPTLPLWRKANHLIYNPDFGHYL